MQATDTEVMDWIGQLGDKDQATSFAAYYRLEQTVMQASRPGGEATRAALAKTLAGELVAEVPGGIDQRTKRLKPPVPKYPAPVRNQVARLLSYMPCAESVPALTKALGDLEIREMARFSLDRNPSAEATRALLDALTALGPTFRAGVVNSLGRRQGPDVLEALRQAAADPDEPVRLAAVEALANFAEPANDGVIARAPVDGRTAQIARLRLAGTLHQAGKDRDARAIYTAIAKSSAAPAQKKAAQLALKG